MLAHALCIHVHTGQQLCSLLCSPSRSLQSVVVSVVQSAVCGGVCCAVCGNVCTRTAAGFRVKTLTSKPCCGVCRRTAAGDQLRMVYDQLSKDPNSLSNLDQDLPNYAQHSVPIFSLPMVSAVLAVAETQSPRMGRVSLIAVEHVSV